MTCLVATVHVSGSQPWWGREWGPSSLPMAQKVPWPGFSVAVVLPCFQGSHGEAWGDVLTSSRGWHLGAADPRPQCSQAVLDSRRRADRERMSLDRRPADLISEHLIRLCVKASVHSSCTQELWGQGKFFSKNKQRDCEFPDLPSRAGKPSHQEHQPRTAGNARQASTALAAPSLCINYLQALS